MKPTTLPVLTLVAAAAGLLITVVVRRADFVKPIIIEKPIEATTPATPVVKHDPIVRLHMSRNGRFFCSGTVIKKNIILTAAHCVSDMPKLANIIEIRNSKDEVTGVNASVINFHRLSDQALLYGDFKDFKMHVMEVGPESIVKAFTDVSSNLLACGYPYGGKLFCNTYKYQGRIAFMLQGMFEMFGMPSTGPQVTGTGFAWPGMSGGPVFDLHTNTVIAIITGVEGNLMVVSPTVEIYENLDVKIK